MPSHCRTAGQVRKTIEGMARQTRDKGGVWVPVPSKIVGCVWNRSTSHPARRAAVGIFLVHIFLGRNTQ